VRRFLKVHRGGKFALSVVALGGFAAGFANLAHETFVGVKARLQLLPTDEVVALHYRDICRFLKARGELIGANDLWIAAHAVRPEAALVTRNIQEFGRVPGLNVLSY
jgi:tRNA(fMet)-specific endonuclease VapC